MSIFQYILLFTCLASLGSLIGGFFLLTRKNLSISLLHYLTAFSAGTLLGTAFFDLLPEAFEHSKDSSIFSYALLGFMVLFLMERFLHWFHHHSYKEDHEDRIHDKSIIPLIIVTDSVHNFIDGVVIALTFLVSIPLGIITTLAIIAHELPQEIGDFGILLKVGLSRGRVLFVNILSALAAMVGALAGFFVGESIEWYLPALLAVAAGFFIYIAAADLVPEIHREHKRKSANIETICLLIGILVIYIVLNLISH